MKTNDVILFGVGLAVGYFVKSSLNKRNVISSADNREINSDSRRDYGNGLFVTYGNDCNEVTHKCPIIEVSFNGTTWRKSNGKYLKTIGSGANVQVVPVEITEKQWIEEAISKVPF